MPPLVDDRDIRERIRRNVGRRGAPVIHLTGPIVPGRYGTIFDRTDLVAGGTPLDGGAAPPLAPTMPTLTEGRIIGIALTVANATRELGVSAPLPTPVVIRALTIHGNVSIASAVSFRVLLAYDEDTAQTTSPTGQDLIEFFGDVIGAEDPGVHAHLSGGSLTVEPWRKILTAGARLKLKVHNLSGGVQNVAVYADLDELVP